MDVQRMFYHEQLIKCDAGRAQINKNELKQRQRNANIQTNLNPLNYSLELRE